MKNKVIHQNTNMVATKGCQVIFLEYHHWYQALLDNNFNKLQDILEKSSEQQGNEFINDPFGFEFVDSNALPLTKQISNRFDINYPLQLMAVLGFEQSFDVLVDKGANIFIQDDYGNNILHLMCYVANANSDEEENLRKFYKYLLKKLSENEINLLLAQKNGFNWNPEVTAISLGTLGIFLEFFFTKGTKYTIELSPQGTIPLK